MDCCLSHLLLFSEFRVFGCLCYAHIYKLKSISFQVVAVNVFLLVTFKEKKGWKLYDLENIYYFVSRDMKFYEHEFPFAQTIVSTTPLSRSVGPNFDHFDFDNELEHVGASVSSHGDVLSGPNVGTNCEMDDMSLVCDGTTMIENVDESNRVHHGFEVTRALDGGVIESSTTATSVENENNGCALREEAVATPTIQVEDEKGKGKRQKISFNKIVWICH